MLWTLVVTSNLKDYIDHLLDGDLNEKEQPKKDGQENRVIDSVISTKKLATLLSIG